MTGRIINKFNALVNRTLKLDTGTLDRLAELSGKVLSLEFINTGLVLFIIPDTDGVRLDTEYPGEADVAIRGSPVNLVAYLMSSSGKGEGFTGRLEIIGDVGLAQDFQSIIKEADLDWEEFLSRWLGDTLAHKMGNMARSTINFARNTKRTLELDVSEYLRYEKEILPEQSEVDEYITAIDELRNDTERLKLRVNKLTRATQEME